MSQDLQYFDLNAHEMLITNLVFRPLYHRIVDHFSHAHRAMAVMEKRALYPRVRLYGGLYCPRRPITDDTLIHEIKSAFDEFFKTTQGEDVELPLPEGFGRKILVSKLCKD